MKKLIVEKTLKKNIRESLQIQSFDWFVDREKSKPCLVAGTAPTIKDFPYNTFIGVYVTCGDGPIRMKEYFKSDYWVNSNDVFPVPEEHLEIINSLVETVFIFADSVVYSRKQIDVEFLRNNLKVKWFSYDQRHFTGNKCIDNDLKCCELLRIYPDRITLQEFIQKKFNKDTHYSSASTVAIHALAFAIILGCSPIYLQGIEIPEYEDQYIHKKNNNVDKISNNLQNQNNRLDFLKRYIKLKNIFNIKK